MAEMKQWDYLVQIIHGTSPNEHQAQLRAFGLDGWELISFQSFVAVFKRPIVAEDVIAPEVAPE